MNFECQTQSNYNFFNNQNLPREFGGHSMIHELKKVLVRAPDLSFAHADPLKWNYSNGIQFDSAIQEHTQLVKILENEGVEILYHAEPLRHHADAIFVHDPVIITDQGAIILKMGKILRQGEEDAMKVTLQKLNIPILHEMSDSCLAEGGDMLWLNPKTLIVGRGFRTNQNAISELKEVLAKLDVQVESFDLICDQGEKSCLHLQSFISLIDEKLAVVFKKYMPVAFYQLLKEQGFKLIDVPENEYTTMATNILTIKPRVCLAIHGNSITKKLLENEGCVVHTYKGQNISLKAEGGPTCLTRPLLRII